MQAIAAGNKKKEGRIEIDIQVPAVADHHRMLRPGATRLPKASDWRKGNGGAQAKGPHSGKTPIGNCSEAEGSFEQSLIFWKTQEPARVSMSFRPPKP